MNSLVAYGSSDDEDEIQPEKPPKIAKTESQPVPRDVPSNNDDISVTREVLTSSGTKTVNSSNVVNETPATILNPSANDEPSGAKSPAPSGPLAGPTLLNSNEATVEQIEGTGPATLSPYTYERQRLRELTMPTVPNFDIPDSPPPPLANSEEAAVLAATTKKFERFLELKKKGVHFNERLQNSSSLRNPSLLPKLMEFAGITTQDSYASSLPAGLAVPVEWPEECYVDGLVKQNERREKKRLAQRDRVDFVPASKTPSSKDGSEHRKSRFDKK